MSFRDRRNFVEMLRVLGYPRIVSLENFRAANFPLVCEILRWIVSRYDSDYTLPASIETEHDRVHFIKSALKFMISKACTRLNAKKLYQADGYAVRELLKVVSVLYSASRNKSSSGKEPLELNVYNTFDAGKIKMLQNARKLASEITTEGANLHSFLQKEIDLKESRCKAIDKQLDINFVTEKIDNAKLSIKEHIESTRHALFNLASDEANLDSKIEKKRSELERNHKRLATLQSVRPAYMEEYEQLEKDLATLYDKYIIKFRNLSYLEAQCEVIYGSENYFTDSKCYGDESRVGDFGIDMNMLDEKNKKIVALDECFAGMDSDGSIDDYIENDEPIGGFDDDDDDEDATHYGGASISMMQDSAFNIEQALYSMGSRRLASGWSPNCNREDINEINAADLDGQNISNKFAIMPRKDSSDDDLDKLINGIAHDKRPTKSLKNRQEFTIKQSYRNAKNKQSADVTDSDDNF